MASQRNYNWDRISLQARNWATNYLIGPNVVGYDNMLLFINNLPDLLEQLRHIKWRYSESVKPFQWSGAQHQPRLWFKSTSAVVLASQNIVLRNSFYFRICSSIWWTRRSLMISPGVFCLRFCIASRDLLSFSSATSLNLDRLTFYSGSILSTISQHP